jgi:hypothetical protein
MSPSLSQIKREDLGAALDVAIHLNQQEVVALLPAHFKKHYESETTDATEVEAVMRQFLEEVEIERVGK